MLSASAAVSASQWPVRSIASATMFEPPRSGTDHAIRLNSNENPYGPSMKCAYAMQDALHAASRYPYLEYADLADAIAAHHGVSSDRVLVGCGSTEILRIAAVTFGGPGKQLVQPSPTFEAITHYAQVVGTEVLGVALTPQYAHDLNAMLARVGPTTGLVYICNPNNPTASLTPRKDLETFLSKLPPNCHVVVDEAYHHFVSPNAPYTSFLDQPMQDERIIVCRTFSKVYGLAGLRLGYAIAAKDVVQQMRPHLLEDSLNAIAVPVGITALADKKGAEETVKKNASVRQLFMEQAKARGIPAIDSQANFAMINTGRPVETVIEHFGENHILVGRKFPAMPTYLRVSFGKPDEMQAFWRTWDTLAVNAA